MDLHRFRTTLRAVTEGRGDGCAKAAAVGGEPCRGDPGR
jgi:hypothetical protein